MECSGFRQQTLFLTSYELYNINTGNLNFCGYYLFNSVSYYSINYLDEVYWIVADKSET